MRFDILSLFPGYFQGPFDESLISRAKSKGIIEIHLVDIRDFADNKWNRVDDRPYGGGPGMVLMPEPVAKAIRESRKNAEESGCDRNKSRVIFLTPGGTPLTAAKCKELSEYEHLVLVSGHYEGIDKRVLSKEVDEEISIGDYVLTNGCIAAIVLVDGISRFIPGVVGDSRSVEQDSYEGEDGVLDCDHYTRPEVFEGEAVPQVLLSGDHKKIAEWRRKNALENTRRARPDLKKIQEQP